MNWGGAGFADVVITMRAWSNRTVECNVDDVGRQKELKTPDDGFLQERDSCGCKLSNMVDTDRRTTGYAPRVTHMLHTEVSPHSNLLLHGRRSCGNFLSGRTIDFSLSPKLHHKSIL